MRVDRKGVEQYKGVEQCSIQQHTLPRIDGPQLYENDHRRRQTYSVGIPVMLTWDVERSWLGHCNMMFQLNRRTKQKQKALELSECSLRRQIEPLNQGA